MRRGAFFSTSTMALRAAVHPVDSDLFFTAFHRLKERDGDRGLYIRPSGLCIGVRSPAAAAAKATAKKAFKYITQVIEPAEAAAKTTCATGTACTVAGVDPSVAIGVIPLTFGGIRKHLVCFIDLFEFGLSLFITGI